VKIIAIILATIVLVGSFVGGGIMLAARSTSVNETDSGIYNIDDIPISVESMWITNSEGYLCLQLDITNNGENTIKDIQGIFTFTDYGSSDTIIHNYGWPSGQSLYLYDSEGRDIHNKQKTKIKPGETLSLVIHKMSRHDVSLVFESHGYITWIEFEAGNNWGTKDYKASDTILNHRAFRVEIEAVYGYSR